MEDSSVTPKEQIIYEMLANAAERGDPCPTNCLLAAAADSTPSGVSAYVSKLEAKGLIKVQRYRMSRVVLITDTGKSTKTTHVIYMKGANRADQLAEYIAEGGLLCHSHSVLGCSPQRVRQLWAQIKQGLGWLG